MEKIEKPLVDRVIKIIVSVCLSIMALSFIGCLSFPFFPENSIAGNRIINWSGAILIGTPMVSVLILLIFLFLIPFLTDKSNWNFKKMGRFVFWVVVIIITSTQFFVLKDSEFLTILGSIFLWIFIFMIMVISVSISSIFGCNMKWFFEPKDFNFGHKIFLQSLLLSFLVNFILVLIGRVLPQYATPIYYYAGGTTLEIVILFLINLNSIKNRTRFTM